MDTSEFEDLDLTDSPSPQKNVPLSTAKRSIKEKSSQSEGPPKLVTEASVTPITPFSLKSPTRDTLPVTLTLRPIMRTKIEIKYLRVVDSELPLVVPKILKYIDDEETLRQCLLVNWCFMAATTSRMYQNISLTGTSGPVLKRLLKLMSKSSDQETLIDYRRCVRSLEVSDIVLDEEEVTPYQSWNTLRELIRRVSPTLERMYLDSTDSRFHDPEIIHPGTCGLDQRVQFSRLKSLTIGPGCLAFPDSFLIDILRKCPRESLVSLRFPGCIKQMDHVGFNLIAERGGSCLQDLILTPPASYPPPTGDPFELGSVNSLTAKSKVGRNAFKGEYDPNQTWSLDEMCEGLLSIMKQCPDLRALDISGHTQGLNPGIIEQLLNFCPNLEELDLPCGITDAVMSELLLAKPKHLWRINAACSSHLRKGTVPQPCSFLTDNVVRAVVEQILPGKVGALLELPTQIMQVKTAKMVPTLEIVEEIGGAKVDYRDTEAVYVPRIGVKVVVPNGRSHT
ncbi:hypothetical protein BDR26DRAFT_851267 [Obelidium mucronatum]|nr:hypothetical protein BDR26DRAFT_851267 [Obelidium mucronatum]